MNISLCVVLLAGCTSLGSRTGQRILGAWRSTIGGYPVAVDYTASTVRVGDDKPVEYRLNGDRLSFEQGGSQVRVVTFPSAGVMVQTDPLTGTSQQYTRVETP